MKKIILLSVILLGLWVVSASAQNLDRVVAVVNDEPITLFEYQSRYKQKLLETGETTSILPAEIDTVFLRALIDERIQYQLAQKQGIVVTDEELDQLLNIVARRNNTSIDQLLAKLKKNGLTDKAFKHSLRVKRAIQKLIERNIKSRVTVSNEEIDYHIKAHSENYQLDQSYEIGHLFLSTSDLSNQAKKEKQVFAENISSEIAKGLSFSDAVKKYSEGGNIGDEGNMGWRAASELPELFLVALAEIRVGETSGVLTSGGGYHILKLLNKRGSQSVVTQYLIRQILILQGKRKLEDDAAYELAQSIITEIKETGDFEKAVRQYSDDLSSSIDGGSLGWISPGEVAPAIEQVISTLKIGALSAPVFSQFGVHIIQVIDKRERDVSFDLIRKRAEMDLRNKKLQARFKNWFDRVRNNAYIEVMSVN